MDTEFLSRSCPEKLILCVDVSDEMNSVIGNSKRSRLDALKRMLTAFIHAKSRMNPRHSFGLVIIREGAHWVLDPTEDVDRVVERLWRISTGALYRTFDFSSLFALVNDRMEIPRSATGSGRDAARAMEAPKYVIRVILFYGRSAVIPITSDLEVVTKTLESQYFFFDAVYLHDKPSHTNNPQDVYDAITAIENEKVITYFFESSTMIKRFVANVNCLLAHPLQRPDQTEVQKILNAVSTNATPPPFPGGDPDLNYPPP